MTTTVTPSEPITYKTLSMHFDEDGYLFDPSQWTPELAHEIAILDGIGPLIKEHFLIIDYVREHYLRFGAMPLMRRVCRANNLHKHAVKKLFGSCRTMWRVAGLPNPGEEAKTYMV